MEYECYRTVKNTLRQEKIAPKSELKMISVPAKPAFKKTSLVLGLDQTREYRIYNPLKWASDSENPDNKT